MASNLNTNFNTVYDSYYYNDFNDTDTYLFMNQFNLNNQLKYITKEMNLSDYQNLNGYMNSIANIYDPYDYLNLAQYDPNIDDDYDIDYLAEDDYDDDSMDFYEDYEIDNALDISDNFDD